MFLQTGRNYVEKQGVESRKRVAFVTKVSLEYVYGFYWRYDTKRKSGFRITLRNFFDRFVNR